MEFEWDPSKDRANRKKHGVSFNTAILAFQDEMALIIKDDRFDYGGEVREILIGMTPAEVGCLLVIFTEREENFIRIISARKATRAETNLYHEENG